MKRIYLLLFLGLLAAATHAQIPQVSDPHCAYCNVNLKTGEAHKSSCPYYEAPKEEESSSYSSSSVTSSAKLKDHEPLPEVKSRLDVSPDIYRLMYQAGDREHMTTCPACGSVAHEGWCTLAIFQKMANEAKAKALAATTPEERRKAIIGFHVCEDNLLESFEYNLAKFRREREEARQKEREQAQQNTSPAPASYQHLSSVDIKNGYDKKIGYGNWATAYGKTFPGGEEMWVLYDQDGNEVGQFSKIETAQIPDALDVFIVRDLNSKWGVYNAGGYAIVEPIYESVKVLIARGNGGPREFYDVTQRDGQGMLRHGIINGSIVSGDNRTIPCACDRIELIDRSPSNRGVLAKITVDGGIGIMDADSGDVIIQPAFSYLNTYFTRRGMYFIAGDGNSLGAYDAKTMEEIVSPGSGKTLDQVRNILDKRDR